MLHTLQRNNLYWRQKAANLVRLAKAKRGMICFGSSTLQKGDPGYHNTWAQGVIWAANFMIGTWEWNTPLFDCDCLL